jgi:hypothetical protein
VTEDTEGGLNLSDPDSIDQTERDRFTRFYEEHKGATLPGHDFWLEHDPGALKRYRKYAIEMNTPANRAFPQVAVLSWLHFYAVIGFEDGISYQIRNAQVRGGAQKSDILATLHTAFLHSGPMGTRYVASASDRILSDYEDPEPVPWPTGWIAAPEAFHSGLDYNRPGLDRAETDKLFDWYRTTCGEVPASVRFLARHNPDALKAYRMRYEHAASAGLPNQMFALMLLQWQVTRGTPEGMREGFALARGLGVSRRFAVDAVTRAMVYTGPSAAGTVAETAGDILDGMAAD